MKETWKTWFVNYESKIQTIDSKIPRILLNIRIRGVKRIIVRSPTGRETLIQQKLIGKTYKDGAIAFVSCEIPQAFLVDEETCSMYVDYVLSQLKVNNNSIQQQINPKICLDVINTSRGLGEEEGERGFLIEAEVQIVKETLLNNWLRINDFDSQGLLIPTEQDCIICQKELSSSDEGNIMKLLCSHGFHKGCILKWLQTKHLCPTCGDNVENPKPETQLPKKIVISKSRNKKK